MLIDKRIERLIKLIYKLSLEDSVNKEELVLDLNCSIRTVDYTLAELQQTFVTKSSSMKIELKPDSILQLSGKDELVIREMLHRLYLQDDMVRFFLEAIAHQQKANTFVEKHFISRATFFRKLKNINTWLRDYQLSFDLRSLQLKGQERQIRQFYYIVLFEITNGIFWPFPFDKQLIEDRLDAIVSTFDLQLSNTQYESFLYLLGSQYHRTSQGHYVDQYDSRFPEEIRQKIIDVCEPFLINIPENNRRGEEDFLLMTVVNAPFTYHPMLLLEQNIAINKKHQTAEWLLTTRFLEVFDQIFPKALKGTTRTHIAGHLLQLHITNRYHPVPFTTYKDVTHGKAIAKQHPALNNVVEQISEKIASIEQAPNQLLKIRYLLLLYTFVDINKFHPPLEMLIVSGEGPVYEEMISEKINDYVPFQLKMVTSAMQQHADSSFPIIVTDTPLLKKSQQNVLYIHYPLTFSDLHKIHEKCERLHCQRLDYSFSL
ncbi:hypothetical protein JCM19046_4753 [Bacillus sp. JCM 19046]|nr:hypothetical protein JCM19045_2962 [Bacillus sp. JCM 19045]GAF20050.1 hypothetical protein JCM19046_4753 [Bacillus sp. JCM 19046]